MSSLTEMIGKQIDGYRIVGVVGRGGMGVVYKAEDTALERVVALKIMDERFTSDALLRERFRSEAKALAKLDTPNIVKVYALRETEIGFCLVMEFIEGETLQARIRREGALSTTEVVGIFAQLLLGLSHAHKAGVIHRDLKPNNILMTRLGTAKIADFGLAKVQRPSDTAKTMAVAGTVYYMSPEQITGLGNVDVRGDIYSLGMTMYEAAAGRLPFSTADSDFAIQLMISQGKVQPISEVNPAVPRDIARLIEKATDLNPAKRFQSAEEMLRALQRISVEDEHAFDRTVPLKKPVIPIQRPRAKPEWPTSAIAGIVLGVAILIAGYFLLRSSPSITIETEPSGAGVYVDGTWAGVSPVDIPRNERKKADVRLELEGYQQRDTVLKMTTEGDVVLSVRLAKSPLAEPVLTLLSDPLGARVSMNGQFVGFTPVSNRRIKPGSYSVQVQKPSFAPKDTQLVLEGGEVLNLTFALSRAADISGTASITVVPGDATVSVDGNEIKRFRLRNFDLPAGKHRVRVTHRDYREKEFELEVVSGQRSEATYKLDELVRYAGVSVSAIPGSAKVFIDGAEVGTTTYESRLNPGRHTIRLVHPIYGQWEKVWNFGPGAAKNFAVDFRKSYAVSIACMDASGAAVRKCKVFVDDKDAGKVTPCELTLPAGTRKIEVRKDGYVSTTIRPVLDDEFDLSNGIVITLQKTQ